MAMRLFPSYLLAATFLLAQGAAAVHAESVNWRTNLDAAKMEAIQSGRLVLLHFWTPSCGPCKILDRDVFGQPQVGATLEKDFVPVKVNADLSPALANAYQIDRVPLEVVLSAQGAPLTKLQCPSSATAYVEQLGHVARHFRSVAPTTPATQSPYPVHPAYAGLNLAQAPTTTSAPTPPSTAPAGMQNLQPQSTNNPYAARATPSHPETPIAPRATLPPAAAVSQAPAAPQGRSLPNHYAMTAPAGPAVVAPPPRSPYTAQTALSVDAPPSQATPAVASTAAPLAPQVQAASAQTALLRQDQTNQPQQTAPQGTVERDINLPAGSPPLGFDGYCPVSLKHEHKWVAGKVEFGAYHLGRTYLFAGAKQQQLFLANPDAYSPVFAGLDVVQMLDHNRQVEGSRRFGYEYRDAFYLFSSQETMARFAENPDRYSAGVKQAMNRLGTTTK